MSISKAIQEDSRASAWITPFVQHGGPRYLQIADMLERALSDGSLPAVDAELPDILLGLAPARRHPDDVVFAYNSGMVVTDVALGRLMADRALTQNRGQRVQLWSA